MDYREAAPSPALEGLVKAFWTLEVGGAAAAWAEHRATPDGCIEIIHRLRGRSVWGREQPALFVAGLGDRPARLRLSGDGCFVGARLWPWTWHLLGGARASAFRNDWVALDAAWLGGAPPSAEALDAALRRKLAALPDLTADARIGRAVLAASSVGEMAKRAGCRMRTLQRWFGRNVGLPPRTYLRLLRFQEALLAVQSDDATLADHAAAQGYADQAHMARDFRGLADAPADGVRRKAVGPFVSP